MKPPAFAYQEHTREKIFQPSEGKSQDQIQHATGHTSCLLQSSLCLTEMLRLDCSLEGTAHEPSNQQEIPGREDDPYAKKTALGWGVIGVVNPIKNKEDDSYCTCHRIASLEVNPSNGKRMYHFALKTKVKDIFQPVEVMKMFGTDFHKANEDGKALSHNDRNFIKKVKEGIHRRYDGHYKLPLPLRDERMMLPNNKELALSRIKELKGRLKHDSKYRKDYQGFMSEIIEKGYAERVLPEEPSLDNGRMWYIPHHGVYHPKKPGKMSCF